MRGRGAGVEKTMWPIAVARRWVGVFEAMETMWMVEVGVRWGRVEGIVGEDEEGGEVEDGDGEGGGEGGEVEDGDEERGGEGGGREDVRAGQDAQPSLSLGRFGGGVLRAIKVEKARMDVDMEG